MATEKEIKNSSKKKATLSVVRRGTLELWNEFRLSGVPMSPEQIQSLSDNGFIERENLPKESVKKTDETLPSISRDFSVSNNAEIEASKYVDIEKESEELEFDTEAKYTKVPVSVSENAPDSIIKKAKKEIKKEDWMPNSIVYHEPDFVLFIDSLNRSFKSKRYYEKYDLYCQQADVWYAENKSVADYNTREERDEYIFEEFDRCRDNSLYFANKYGYLTESSMEFGRRKYYADENYEHQRVICYLFDCGYSVMLGKPRQVGVTSIYGMCAMKKTLFQTNHAILYIAKDLKATERLFKDKILFVHAHLPNFMQGEIASERDTIFRVGKKEKKGSISAINSYIEVVAPSPTAINSASPPVIFIDEIGDIPVLTEMLLEGRPTIFWKNPKTKKLEQKRQIIAFGTGGKMDRGKGAFEREWSRTIELWMEGKYDTGIIPLFFDWTTRCDEEEYNSQKDFYYGGAYSKEKNVDLEQSKIQFHQHFPSTPADMFAISTKTLVSRDYIEEGFSRIRNLSEEARGTWGYFIPKFDMDKPDGENSDIPFKLIGAEFVPCDDMDQRCTTFIMSHPKRNWRNRYYQGTDPISADTGVSKMASAIWDRVFNAPVAIVNHRESHNAKYSFLQCVLLGLYYDTDERGMLKNDVKELLERNIGLAYRDYKTNKGFFKSFVFNSELPDHLQAGGTEPVGIDNNPKINRGIIDKMTEVFNYYGQNIYIPTVWGQAQTFVCKSTDSGRENWTSMDKRFFYDDVLFAVTYAYICSLCYQRKVPMDINVKVERRVEAEEYKIVYDANYNAVRVKVN